MDRPRPPQDRDLARSVRFGPTHTANESPRPEPSAHAARPHPAGYNHRKHSPADCAASRNPTLYWRCVVTQTRCVAGATTKLWGWQVSTFAYVASRLTELVTFICALTWLPVHVFIAVFAVYYVVHCTEIPKLVYVPSKHMDTIVDRCPALRRRYFPPPFGPGSDMQLLW
jgi:hypothetical protein